MKLVSRDSHRCQLLVRHLDPGLVRMRIKLRLDLQACPGRRVPNQVDHHRSTHQGPTTPILGDMAKHPVLDLVPLARPRWEMADRDAEPDLIGQPLQL